MRRKEKAGIIDHMGIMARCVDDAIGYWVQETAHLTVHRQETSGAAARRR
ncbi:hypothetical protein [Streptomyces sp. NPDC058335]